MNRAVSVIRAIWLHPAVQVAAYLTIFVSMLYLLWNVFVVLVPRNLEAGLMVQEILQSFISLFCLWLVLRFVQHRTVASAGIVRQGLIIETMSGFLLGILVSAGAILGMAMVGAYQVLSFSFSLNLLFPLILFLFAALTEEVVFRIFIFQTCERKWGTVKAIAITSIIFGLVHMINSVHGATFEQKLTGCVFLIFEAGYLLNAAFLVRRRIWLPLGLHWSWNFFEGPVFGTNVSGNDFGVSTIHAGIKGPFWATGGAFGPEGSLPGLIVGILFAVFLTWYAIKNGAWNQVSPVEGDLSKA